MIKKKEKRRYEPPRAIDLSALSANGQVVDPLGVCSSPGYYPYELCHDGDDYATTPCEIGGTPSHGCEFGNAPSGTQCSPYGSTADSQCTGGWYQ